MPATQNWAAWALLSAAFAALTAIFAKVGLEGIDSDYATLLRTAVIVVVLASLVAVLGKWSSRPCFSGSARASGTGARWGW